MSHWAIAIAACSLLGLALYLWRRHAEAREALLARVAELEERAGSAEAELRRCADNVGILQRLLLEKGVADEEDFEAARRADQLEALGHQRGVH